MTDVLRIAMERRTALQEEIAKIEEFIRMAEMLMRDPTADFAGRSAEMPERPVRPSRVGGTEPERQRISEDDSFSAPARPQVIRRTQNNGTSG